MDAGRALSGRKKHAMSDQMRRSTLMHRRLGAVLAAVCLFSGTAGISVAQSTPTWAKYSAKTKTARLIVIAAYGQDTYNFDGGSNGQFTFTVPLGSKVVVTFTNDSQQMPHAAEIVAYDGTLPATNPPPQPAFKGAASPDYLHGTPPGVTVKFSFKASKAGKYLLICPVHNHVKLGHWDWFVVSKKAKTVAAVLKP
jgi:FtsP/CotA-like multicopper oxidase with cupredoxin domain